LPFTPYHFGPSGFVALVLRRWIDIPVFILANVIVDIEVLVIAILGLGYPIHRYAHTLLIGAVAGAVWGALAYKAKPALVWAMQQLRVPYKTNFWKMVASGILGVWLHVFIDAIYHGDVRIFWPSRAIPLFGLISRGQVKAICVALFAAAVIPYAIAAKSYTKQDKAKE